MINKNLILTIVGLDYFSLLLTIECIKKENYKMIEFYSFEKIKLKASIFFLKTIGFKKK